MSRIFISHSSANNASALALRDWLKFEGWDDLFLDLDPERGIVAGERWERALNEAALRCEAVLFLVSREWLASGWCLKEFHLASKLNKRTFGLLIDGLTIAELPAEITSDWQLVDLASGRDHVSMRAVTPNGGVEEHVTFSQSGLARLKAGLRRAGLDPKFFAWPPDKDPDRSPYRGLKALEAEDAGIFFGREAETIAVLDRLRGLREAAPPRFLAILGASGAGKSSFLRAGVLPRLSRDDRNFLPLPVIRPERLPISGESGLLKALATACSAARMEITRAQVQAALTSGAHALLALLGRLAEASRVPAAPGEPASDAPTLVLSIDHGEELFLAEAAVEATTFLTLLRDIAATASPHLIVLIAIRSDAYERLQAAPELDGLRQETFSLPPLPRGSYQSVIEGPARRFREAQHKGGVAERGRLLRIEPALTQTLLADIEAGGAKDALPLLAFTLERLYVDHGGNGNLTLTDYRQTGGAKGSIEAAVERAMQAADGDPRVPRDRAARLTLMRRALIPWLAGIDPETGSPRRRVARLAEVPEEARPLVDHLIDARLLRTDIGDNHETTVEPAHEALLRQWGLLEGWLQEDLGLLTALEGVKRSAREWEANARADAWLAHQGERLAEARAVDARPDIAARLDALDQDYLLQCGVRTYERSRADEALRKEQASGRFRDLIAEVSKPEAFNYTRRYVGLSPFGQEDAGVFFGREAMVAECLTELSKLCSRGIPLQPRIMVITGGLGTGKTSLLQAGILPRLSRLQLGLGFVQVIRPGSDVFYGPNGLASSLGIACDGACGAPNLKDFLAQITQSRQSGPTETETQTLVIPVDQAEQLFDSCLNADDFLQLAREVSLQTHRKTIFLFTIRSDRYEELEKSRLLRGLSHVTITLRSPARADYRRMITGPADRFVSAGGTVHLDPKLVDRLVSDVSDAADGLPLLAQALARIDATAEGEHLDCETYATLGEGHDLWPKFQKALDELDGAPSEKIRKFESLLPFLIQIDGRGKLLRRSASLASLPESENDMVEKLLSARLLIVEGEKDQICVRLSSPESQLRECEFLTFWLQRQQRIMSTLTELERDAEAWSHTGRNVDWLAHSGARLELAKTVLNKGCTSLAREYVLQCEQRERSSPSVLRRVRRFLSLK